MDQQVYFVIYNLTRINFEHLNNSTIIFSNMLDPPLPKVEITRVMYLTPESTKDNIISNLTVQFVDKTSGEPFNIYSNDLKVESI